MLANYDAKAVADVMGIAFQDDPAGSPAKTARSRNAAGEYVIEIDHNRVRVVDFARQIAEPNKEPPSGVWRRAKNSTFHSADQSIPVRSPSHVLIEKAVEKGLPRFVLRHVAEQIAGDDKARIASLEWGVVPRSTLERREDHLSPLESERTERVARLFVHARRALGSTEEAREFMLATHPQIDGRTPIDAAKTDLGARRVEQILNALEYGLAV